MYCLIRNFSKNHNRLSDLYKWNKLIMKKNVYKLVSLLFACCILTSCEKDEIMFYNEDYNAIRFPVFGTLSTTEPTGYDSQMQQFVASWSFVEDPLVLETIYDLPVMLIGKVADYDRKILFNISDESFAPSDSYEILDAVIPAGEMKGYIRFKLYNLEVLNEATYAVVLNLEASEGLHLGPAQYLKAYFSWNNSIPAPTNTNFIRTYNMLIMSSLSFISTSTANYSPNALKTIVSALGWNDWDDYSIHGVKYNNSTTYGAYKYLPRYTMIYNDNSYKSYALKLKNYIENYNKEHPDNPLVHDIGGLKGQPIVARTY